MYCSHQVMFIGSHVVEVLVVMPSLLCRDDPISQLMSWSSALYNITSSCSSMMFPEPQVQGFVMDGPGAVCMLMLIPLLQEGLRTRSELYLSDVLRTNPLMNKGVNHWANRRNFRVGERKRGSRREVHLDRDSMRTRCNYECLPGSMVDPSGFTTGGFRFKAYKLGFQLLCPVIELPLFLN